MESFVQQTSKYVWIFSRKDTYFTIQGTTDQIAKSQFIKWVQTQAHITKANPESSVSNNNILNMNDILIAT